MRDRARCRWHLALETAEEQETCLFRRRAQHKAQQAALTTQAREASSNKQLLCDGQEQWKCPRRERLVYIKSAAGKSNGDVQGERVLSTSTSSLLVHNVYAATETSTAPKCTPQITICILVLSPKSYW